MTGVPTPGAMDGSHTSRSNDTWTPPVPLVTAASARSITPAIPSRSTSFMVKAWMPKPLTISFSRSSRLRMPTSAVCSGRTDGLGAADPGQLQRLAAEQRRQRHAVDVAGRGRGRRVDVGVSVHPDQPELLAAGAQPRRRRGHRAGAEAVVAAERDRQSALVQRGQRGLMQLGAHAGDLPHVALVRIAGPLQLGDRRRDVALVDHASRRARRAARPDRRSGSPTDPCRRRGGCRRGRAGRR